MKHYYNGFVGWIASVWPHNCFRAANHQDVVYRVDTGVNRPWLQVFAA